VKASKVFKLYCWAELAFVGYLLLKPKKPAEPSLLDDLQKQLKEKDNGTQDP
jgi:hypothetical protein